MVHVSRIFLEFFLKPADPTMAAEKFQIYGAKITGNLDMLTCWSQVLINSTIFATFTFLVSVLLCHNLHSSMMKCEGSLT